MTDTPDATEAPFKAIEGNIQALNGKIDGLGSRMDAMANSIANDILEQLAPARDQTLTVRNLPTWTHHQQNDSRLLVIPTPFSLDPMNWPVRPLEMLLLSATIKKVPTRTGPCCAPSACHPC